MVYNMFSYVLCEIVCLVNSIGGKVEHEGQKKKKITLDVPEFMGRTVQK